MNYTKLKNPFIQECFINFVELYRDNVTSKLIEDFILFKSKEKEILEAYELEFITTDELCSFFFSHLYTRFVQEHHHKSVVSKEVENIYKKLKIELEKLG